LDFSLTDEQTAWRESIVRFARKELNPGTDERARAGEFPWEEWRRCAGMQILALPFPERYGGCGADFLTTALSLKALGYACTDGGLVHAIATQILCGLQLLLFGDDEQKERYLPALCSGDKVFAQAITEPGSGSDALALRARAVNQGEGYLLDGTKTFITNGPIADVVLAFARTDPEAAALFGISCFIVERDIHGFDRGTPMEKMGLTTLQNGELIFDGTAVPEAQLLGRVGQGAMLFSESMEWERALLPAVHLGTLERVIETCVEYVKQREAFGKPIGEYQAVSHKVAEMKVSLELGTLIMCKVAQAKVDRRRAPMDASVCKLYVGEALKAACLDAVQLHGGYGYMAEYGVERDLRDAIAATIYSGTSEMQRNLIARLLGL
jgi:alkylation response protein AidB-like acyl-CoA dehydrogenase